MRSLVKFPDLGAIIMKKFAQKRFLRLLAEIFEGLKVENSCSGSQNLFKNDIFILFLASRKVPEGLVGVAQKGKKSAMVVVKCESEPVSKTPEFNRLVQFVASALTSQNPGEYESADLLALEGVKDNLVENIGLLKENIQIQKGICVEAENCGIYVRSKNKDFPNNGTYGSIVG